MNNSSYLVYTTIRNIQIFCSGKDVDDIFTPNKGWRWHFDRELKDYFKNHFKRIYNEIENSYYNKQILACFCLYKYAICQWENKPNLYEINQKNIDDFVKTLQKKRVLEDYDLIKQIHKQFNFKSVKDLLNPLEDGTHILYILTKNKRISILTYLKILKKFLTNDNENIIFNTVDLKRFKRTSIKFYETFYTNTF